MRYILDNNGYVELCSKTHIECNGRGCTEYTGTIPTGYSSIEEWAANANIRAYKVVDGNLVYDPERDSDLQKEYEREAEDNTLATHRYVKDKLSVSNSVVTDEFSSEKSSNSLIVLDDTGNYEIPYLKVESVAASYVNVISSNKNILGVEVLSSTVNGVRFDVSDGTITLNGTATDNIEFNLNGSSTNTEMLFLMKNDIDYAISGLANNVSLSLYSFDGTNRTSVYTGFNDVVKLSNPYLITQATLNIASGTTFNGVVISPQVEINNRPTSFIKHEETKSSGKLINNECVIEDLMSYEGNTIIMIDEEVTSSIKYYTHQFLNEKFAEIEVREGEISSTVSEMNKTIEGQNQKISQVTQSVDEINSKITDIADITTSEGSDYASVNLFNVNESEPMAIKIHPINEDVSYLYPKDTLYPSDDLYLKCRTIRFTNTKTNKVFDYELPADLLYYDANTYDEFNLNYDSKTCSVTKRVEYIDAEGNKGVKTKEDIIPYGFPTIPLTSGDYNVSLLGYSGVYLFVQLMAANLYTTQFATKVELSSSITQTKDSITSEVKAEYATKDELNTSVSTIKQTTDSINLEVAKKVNNSDYTSAQILMKINNDTSSTVIKSDKLDVNAIATFTNNKLAQAGSTTINGANITTGHISCDILKGGTISGQTIRGGTISGSNITATSGSIGGFGIDGSEGLSGSYGTIRPNGNLLLYPNYGSARYVLSSAMTFNAQGGVVIASNSNANISAPSSNLDLKACSGGVAYLGCMATSAGTSERSAVSCADGVLNLRSAGTIYANGAAIGGSSSKNTKTNIVKLSQEKKDELYGLIKDVPLYEYDYKPEYGKKVNYGFLIEDVEDTKLNDLLHIVEVNENIKTYCSEDLTRLNLIMIKELMNKVETLENKIKELESDKNGKN